MNLEIIETGPLQREVHIAVPSEQVDKEFDQAIEHLQGRVKVKGFRPGRVPRREIERRYGKGMRRDVVRALIQRTLSDALREEQLKSVLYVSPPEVVDDSGTGGFSYRFKAEIKPDVHPTGYLGVKLQAPEAAITDEQVDAEVEKLRQRHAVVEPVEDREVVEAGDFLLVRHQRLDQPGAQEGQSHVDLNDDHLRPEMRDALIGASVGESRDVVLAVEDDADATAVPAQLRLRVEAIKRRVLPEVDDELAESAAGVGSVAELREKLRGELQKQADQERRRGLLRKLQDALLAGSTIELPKAFLESRLDDEVEHQLRMLTGGRGERPPISGGELRERLREEVERRLRLEFLLGAIADRESIQVTDGEVERAVSDLVRTSGQLGPSLQKAYADRAARAGLGERLRLDKTLDFLLTKATISNEEPGGATSPEAADAAGGEAGGSGEAE